MKRALRVISAAAALAAASLPAPAVAQDADAPATNITLTPPAAPSNSADTVGPAQLRNFSLPGTVTRRSDTPAPAARPERPQATAPASAAATRPAETPVDAPAAAAQRSGPAAPRPVASSTAQPAPAFNFGPPTPAEQSTTGFAPQIAPQPSPSSAPLESGETGVGGGLVSHWPWLLALLAAAGAALWYFRRPRAGYAFAGAGAGNQFDLAAPEPAPTPRPRPAPPAPPRTPSPPPSSPPVARAPVPQLVPAGGVVSTRLRAAPEVLAPERPPAPATAPVGIVSSRLRPWLEFEFQPLSAAIDASQATIEFEVTLFNSGSAPAREVLLEARLFNAGDDQDQAIAQFFANPVAQGERVPLIAPLQRMAFRSKVSIARDLMRIFDGGGRPVFVPLIGFNGLYRWSSGEGQSSASYIIGRNTSGEKMAPFVVGEQPKTFRGLAAHAHALNLRK